jgi:hypothetical protein
LVKAMQQESQKVKRICISFDKCIQLEIKLLKQLPNVRKLQNLDNQRIGVG